MSSYLYFSRSYINYTWDVMLRYLNIASILHRGWMHFNNKWKLIFIQRGDEVATSKVSGLMECRGHSSHDWVVLHGHGMRLTSLWSKCTFNHLHFNLFYFGPISDSTVHTVICTSKLLIKGIGSWSRSLYCLSHLN